MATEEKALHIRQAEGLRALADMIEAHSELAQLMKSALRQMLVSVGHGDGLAQDDLLAFLRAAGPAAQKNYTSDEWMAVDVELGGVSLYVYVARKEVCERVVVGTETVTTSVPDPEKLASVPTVEVTEVVEQVEWRCSPLLASASDGVA